MEDCWNLLKKELKIYGIDLIDDQFCQVRVSDNRPQKCSISKIIARIKKRVESNKKIFSSLWRETIALLSENNDQISNVGAVDNRVLNLFIYSLKDAAKLIDVFEELDNTFLKQAITGYLSEDICKFSAKQIQVFSDYKISIDWVFREINKSLYVLDLLRFASAGEAHANSFEIKTAKGVSGPWGNLDLPMLERVWPWKDEDENLRGRMKDIRRQRRYQMGLESYNNNGSISDGFYWRELRNEPFSWYNRSDEDPYYQRYLLTRN